VTVEAGGTLEGVFLAMGCGTAAGAGKMHVEIHDVAAGPCGCGFYQLKDFHQ